VILLLLTFVVEYVVMSMAMRDVLLSRHRAKAVSKRVGMEPTDLATIKTMVRVRLGPGWTPPEVEAFHSTLRFV
jgi:hypothetical protein